MAWGAGLALATFVGAARGSELEAATGLLKPSADALLFVDFESAERLADEGFGRAQWRTSGASGIDGAPSPATELAKLVVSAPGRALSGDGMLQVGNLETGKPGQGAVLAQTSRLGAWSGQIEVSAWVRAEGAMPELWVLYGKSDWQLDLGDGFRFARVLAIPTGRATSDGWIELSTGPIEGTLWDVPMRGIALVAPRSAPAGAIGYVDALEIRPATTTVVPPVPCTLDDVDKACGAAGVCLMGTCAPDWAVYGPLPAKKVRDEIATWWSTAMLELQGNRSFDASAKKHLADLSKLAAEATTSRAFFGGLAAKTSAARDWHTRFPLPPSQSSVLGSRDWWMSSLGIGACFGEAELDVMGGGRGFAVFAVEDAATDGTRLQVGDVLRTIDGKDARAWLDAHRFELNPAPPNDPLADPGEDGWMLAGMLTQHASTFTVERCTSKAACTGADRKTIEIKIGAAVRKQVLSNGWVRRTFYTGKTCEVRFKPAVPGAMPTNGLDNVYAQTIDGVATFQFDGFNASGAGWTTTFADEFKKGPKKLLLDARRGHGGYLDRAHWLAEQLRPGSMPIADVLSLRASTDAIDGPWTYARRCPDSMLCPLGWPFFWSSTTTPGPRTVPDDAKIAWLGIWSGSANDNAPRLLKGRAGFRLYMPNRTIGAFGAVSDAPFVLSGWSGYRYPSSDTKYALDYASLAAAPWESGKGAEPDVVSIQTQSDLLDDKDTMLAAARAWLME